MTKRQQQEILKNAIMRLHFHRTMSEDSEKEGQICNALITFAHNLHRAEHIENTANIDKKSVDEAYALAYLTLQKETV